MPVPCEELQFLAGDQRVAVQTIAKCGRLVDFSWTLGSVDGYQEFIQMVLFVGLPVGYSKLHWFIHWLIILSMIQDRSAPLVWY